MDSRIWIPLVSGAGLLDIASAAIPTPFPTTLTVPTVASAAKPTAEAVTLTAVLATVITVQPVSMGSTAHSGKESKAAAR